MELFVEKVSSAREREMDKIKQLIKNTEVDGFVVKIFEKFSLFGETLKFLGEQELVEKIFKIIVGLLKKMNETDIQTSILNDLISRLVVDLHKLNPQHYVILLQLCQESISLGDPKVCLFFKDLLPAILKLLKNENRKVNVEGEFVYAKDYYVRSINDVLNMKWPKTVLSPIAKMFSEIELTKEQLTKLLAKLCESLRTIDATEIPSLAHQMFYLTRASQLILIPLLALNKYFYLHHYKQKFKEIDSEVSDYDSIEEAPEKTVVDAEETVIYHFQSVTKYTSVEKDLVAAFKCLSYTPQYILTPFLLGALLSVVKVSSKDSVLIYTQSPLLQFIVKVIKNSEHAREIKKSTAWIRNLESFTIPDIEKTFNVVIENSKTGKETSTEGLVALAFMLLKLKKCDTLNHFGSEFLLKFVKERTIQFIPGIVENLVAALLTAPEKPQISECFSNLALSCSKQVSNCESTIKGLMEDLLNINDESVLTIMTVINPLIKVCFKLREKFLEVLRTAIYQRNTNSRKAGVFGFCQVLMKVKTANSRRIGINALGALSQLSISGFSLVSQASISHTNNPQRNFDVMVLEIIGILQKCFAENIEIKKILYFNLERAVTLNPKIMPHVLLFIETHFREIFDNDVNRANFDINFSKVLKENDDKSEIIVMDQIGMLLHFVVRCVLLCEEKKMECDLTIFRSILENLMDKIDTLTLEDLGIFVNLDFKTSIIGPQYLNCIEALMEYGIAKNYYGKIKKLFRKYQTVYTELKKLSDKKPAKKKSNNDSSSTEETQKVVMKIETVMESRAIGEFLKLIFDDSINLDTNQDITSLRTDRDLSRYILRVCHSDLEMLKNAPDFLHLKYSETTFSLFSQTFKMLYKNCLKNLKVLMEDFDLETAFWITECFKESLLVFKTWFKRKLSIFLIYSIGNQGVTVDARLFEIVKVIQEFIDSCYSEDTDRFFDDDFKEKIIINLFLSLELLYEHFTEESSQLVKSCQWLTNFCSQNTIDRRHLSILNKIMFNLRMRVEVQDFLLDVALQFNSEYGQINVELDEEDPNGILLKSITQETVDETFLHYLKLMKGHLENIDFLVLKMNSLNDKIKIPGQLNVSDYVINLKALERAMSMKMIRVMKVMIALVNTDINSVDGFMKILIQFYASLTNMIRHYVGHHDPSDVNFNFLGVEDLIRSSKKLATRIYDDMIPHIEEHAKSTTRSENGKKRKLDLNAQKQKVIRETKHIPRLIFCIENFNKWVGNVDQKIKSNLSKFLHFGETRDFRLKDKDLSEAINRVRREAHPSQASTNDSEDENRSDSSSGESSNSENESDNENTSQHSERMIVEEDSEISSATLRKNVAILNKKTKRGGKSLGPAKSAPTRTNRGVLKSKENKSS